MRWYTYFPVTHKRLLNYRQLEGELIVYEYNIFKYVITNRTNDAIQSLTKAVTSEARSVDHPWTQTVFVVKWNLILPTYRSLTSLMNPCIRHPNMKSRNVYIHPPPHTLYSDVCLADRNDSINIETKATAGGCNIYLFIYLHTHVFMYKLVALIGSDKRNAFIIGVQKR